MPRQTANTKRNSQFSTGSDRCILMLEGLWDQLEATASTLRTGEEQPSSIAVAKARLHAYKGRMRELLAQFRTRAGYGAEMDSYRTMTSTLTEVTELLDTMETGPVSEWIGILYQAQDTVVGSLHELRQSRYVAEEQRLLQVPVYLEQ